jgi:competence protein ComEA
VVVGLSRYFASRPVPVVISGSPAPKLHYRINLNTADAPRLQLLPGIGPVIANAIVEYRLEHGPFEKISDLRRVPGVGQKKVDAIRSYVTLRNEKRDRE